MRFSITDARYFRLPTIFDYLAVVETPAAFRRRRRRLEIAIADPGEPEVRDLLAERDRYFAALYPARETTALPGLGLDGPDVAFFTVRGDGKLLGCGALICSGRSGELKRFFIRPVARGLGLGACLLAAAEREAGRRGLWRIRLEVGRRQPGALSLYRNAGYRPIRSFGRYVADPLSLFFLKTLRPARRSRPSRLLAT